MANCNHLAEDASIQGARAWHRFDGITTVAMKAMAYLTWASPAFNPHGDVSRWEKAAEYAAEVMKFKLEVDGAQMGRVRSPDAFPMVRSQQPRNRLFIFRLHGV